MSTISQFSKKQLALLTWWCDTSPHRHHDAIICDGAIRSGKTLCMSLSFVWWAMFHFDRQSFALCGKTVTSLRRNVVRPLLARLHSVGFSCEEKVSKSFIDIRIGNRENRFYLFGGKDEGSASLIQGITLAGVLLDEVALMPRSFTEQAIARCSVEGSRFWFNCNPEHPYHWFYREWIQKRVQKNALYLHFTMKDNPSLSDAMRRRYESLYSGAFYHRFIEGKWVSATGVVYPMFDQRRHLFQGSFPYRQYYISCDYGTVNPTSMGLWGEHDGIWYRIAEYYYDSKVHQQLRTDQEHYDALLALAGDLPLAAIVVDPSAASFMECIRRHGKFRVLRAKNDVISGIRRVADALLAGTIRFHPSCVDTIREFALYSWEEGAKGDSPKKENDHAMDEIRYFVNTILHQKPEDFFLISSIAR